MPSSSLNWISIKTSLQVYGLAPIMLPKCISLHCSQCEHLKHRFDHFLLLWKHSSGSPLPSRWSPAFCCMVFHSYDTKKEKQDFPGGPVVKNLPAGFPGGAVVESLPANAGDTGSSPGLGGSHMPRSGWAREPQLLSLRVWSLCPATGGGAAMVRGPRTAMKSGSRSAMKSGLHLP